MKTKSDATWLYEEPLKDGETHRVIKHPNGAKVMLKGGIGPFRINIETGEVQWLNTAKSR